jgi:AsmA family protein
MISLGDVFIANADWAKAKDPNIVHVGRLDLAMDIWQLLHGRILVPEINISRPRVLLERNAQGEANWQFSTGEKAKGHKRSPGAAEGNTGPSTSRLDQGHFVYNDARTDRNAALDVSRLRITDNRADRKVEVTGGGKFKIKVKGEAQA